MADVRIKQVNQFRPNTVIINDDDPGIIVNNTTVEVKRNNLGYYTLGPGTYEVQLEGVAWGDTFHVRDEIVKNGILINSNGYLNREGKPAGLMTVTAGYLQIKPNTVVGRTHSLTETIDDLIHLPNISVEGAINETAPVVPKRRGRGKARKNKEQQIDT